jgi:hypothetical protein
MVPRALLLALRLGLALAAAAAAGACNGSAVGVDACKSIEEARCRQVPNCPNVQVSPPVYYTSGSATDACIRYYDVACAHGLAVGVDPGTSAVNACVSAIENDGCDVVAAPETDPACAWLEPPDSGAGDARDASDAAEAASDGSAADAAGE